MEPENHWNVAGSSKAENRMPNSYCRITPIREERMIPRYKAEKRWISTGSVSVSVFRFNWLKKTDAVADDRFA